MTLLKVFPLRVFDTKALFVDGAKANVCEHNAAATSRILRIDFMVLGCWVTMRVAYTI